jgi:hypothetical protein
MNYYESKDLKRFAEVGKFRKELMDKFFNYNCKAVPLLHRCFHVTMSRNRS